MQQRSLRVAYVLNAPSIGGGNQSFLTLWHGLAAHGVTPLAISPADGPMVQSTRSEGFACEVIAPQQMSWRQPIRWWRIYRRWLKTLTSFQAQLIHANDIYATRTVALPASRLGIPVICHVRYPPEESTIAWVFAKLPKPRLFVFNSEALRQKVGATFASACPGVEQVVVYNAVDLERFQPRPKSPDAPARVGIIANLGWIKRHDVFFAMARALLDRGRCCEFWVVGDDTSGTGYRGKLQAEAAQLGLNGQLKFLGFCPRIEDVIPDLDVVVSCSDYETFGRSLIEAMACERPVVATAVGGMPEVVEDGKTGFLVPANDAKALADAVERLLADASLRRNFGQAGRARAHALFSSPAHARQVLAIYKSLVTAERGPRSSTK